MGRLFVFLCASLISVSSHALRIEDTLIGPSGLSPLRPRNTSYQQMALKHEVFSQFMGADYATVYMSRNSYQRTNWQLVPEVTAEELERLFLEVRDKRMLKDSKGRNRRITFLYPDNGCFARAEMMTEEAGRIGVTKPAKIFAFGNLSVNTDFHPDGLVTWWYHVAPILRVGTEAYVLDPSLEARRPLPVGDWVKLMNSSVDVSICSSHSYDPDSLCNHKAGSQVQRALHDENYFMSEEWNRILDLGRNPEYDLGDYPPWSNHNPVP